MCHRPLFGDGFNFIIGKSFAPFVLIAYPSMIRHFQDAIAVHTNVNRPAELPFVQVVKVLSSLQSPSLSVAKRISPVSEAA